MVFESEREGSMSEERNHIKIWLWRDAPEEYRDLSRHSGDEDWVMLVGRGVNDWYKLPPTIRDVVEGSDSNYSGIWGDTDHHMMENGDIIVIFAHS
jgi:hypothetical protein